MSSKYSLVLPFIYKSQEKGAFNLDESFKILIALRIIEDNKNNLNSEEQLTDLEVLNIIKQALCIGNVKGNFTFSDVSVIKEWFDKNK